MKKKYSVFQTGWEKKTNNILDSATAETHTADVLFLHFSLFFYVDLKRNNWNALDKTSHSFPPEFFPSNPSWMNYYNVLSDNGWVSSSNEFYFNAHVSSAIHVVLF